MLPSHNTFESEVRNQLVQIINDPLALAWRAATKEAYAQNIDFANIKAEASTRCNDQLVVTYTHPEFAVTLEITVDEARWKDCVYIKIGSKRKAFRLVTVKVPDLTSSACLQTQLKKNICSDVPFQKALLKKVITFLATDVKWTATNLEEKKKQESEKADIVLQFPDWDVERAYSYGWDITHKTKRIQIRLTRELDLERITLPTDKFTCYPDETFMENLLALFEEKPDPSANSPF